MSKLHILAASYRAINDALEGRLKSRNIHSEIVFSLSMNNNIAESFRRFGITPSTTSLLVVKVAPASSASQISEHLSSSIEGEAVPFEDGTLSKMTDIARVKKLYKLNASGGGGGKKGAVNGVSEKIQDERKELEIMVLGAMALRGATN
ncbi:16432d8d-74f0-4f90-84b9-cf01ec903180 [Sclerotinia trifoliorum]|uniref:EKC/KEOPS complex subunit CGI121 n=1 Tax=Sclerotinia trifoliorum TaxID=28548 RepID=A0A8H2VQ97_9HELO|nr:16432d8d-74f0-4f90-84b9-cf01ec903180 [Sclerotinia trifoliorum]